MNNSEDSSTTVSYSVSDVQAGMKIFLTACMSIIISVSLCGNVLVLIAFKVNQHLRSVSNYFILNLAISDLLTTIFAMPFDLDILRRGGVWKHGDLMCNFYTTTYLISAPASILILLAVSIDRYRVISDPFVYQRTTTPSRVLIVCALIWVYSTLMGLVPTMGWEGKETTFNTTDVCYFSMAEEYSIMISVLHFVIPPLIMAVVYFKIYEIARSHVRRIHRLESVSVAKPPLPPPPISTPQNNKRSSKVLLSPPKDPHSPTPAECNGHSKRPLKRRFTYRYSVSAPPMLRKNVKAAKSLAVIVGTFFTCWYPYTILSMAVNACGGIAGSCTPPFYIFDLLLTVGYLSCALNPFLYAFHNAEFKKTYKKILRCKA